MINFKGKEANMSYLLDADRNRIENKYHCANQPFDPFNRMAHHGYDYDESTGLSDKQIDEGLSLLVSSLQGKARPIIKAEAFAFVLDHTRIDVNENDYFVGLYSWGRLLDKHTVLKWKDEAYSAAREEIEKAGLPKDYLDDLSKTGAVWLVADFDHTVPDWDSLLTLGFAGILERAKAAFAALERSGTATQKQRDFYLGIVIEYEAILRFLERLYAYSLTKHNEKSKKISACLNNLCKNAPSNFYEALQLIYLYFMISESVDHYQVRSLGYGLDSSLSPFYFNDLKNGTFTKEELSEFLAHFLLQFSAIGNYWGQPFYLGGSHLDGTTKINDLSYLILDVYDKLGLYNPKIQIKTDRNTPKEFILKVLEIIRGGNSSFVFCNSDTIVKAMMRSGATYEKALDAVIKGCYEYAIKGECVGISFNTFNALKPVELVFFNGKDKKTGIEIGLQTGNIEDFTSFEQFYKAYLAQFRYLIENSLICLDALERRIEHINPAPLYSATVPNCVNTMTDALGGGILNVSDMLLNGFGTAVDALMAVYELVFEKKVTTMKELSLAVAKNWKGFEKLRQKALSCKHKYGVNDEIADFYACALHRFFADAFASRKNTHGGNYEYELHSALAFIQQGEHTAATPDGRFDGEETSKNGSPTMGADKKGVTALIASATKLDLALADSGACLDVMLHPSAISGEDGLRAFYGVLDTYFKQGGASVHFNVLSAELLEDAQKNPQKYRNLQVRVCGWNVLWNNMKKSEQDAYIRRAKSIE